MNAQPEPNTERQLVEWYARATTQFDESPIHRTMGLSLESMTAGKVEILLECPPEFRNAHGNIHGGLLTTALDSAVLQAVRSQTPGLFTQSTIELKANFMRPAVGAIVRIEGIAIHVGRTTGVARALAVGGDGRAVAAALGTIHIARKSAT